jgi:CHAD domain-containing protein
VELARAQAFLRSSSPRAVLLALSCLPWPTLAAAERDCSRRFATRVVRAAQIVERKDRTAADVHRWRRRVRRARYALEWLGRDSTRARELQDLLGEWHDAAIEEADLARGNDSVQEPERDAAPREREALLERALDHFAADRKQWLAFASAEGRAWTSG